MCPCNVGFWGRRWQKAGVWKLFLMCGLEKQRNGWGLLWDWTGTEGNDCGESRNSGWTQGRAGTMSQISCGDRSATAHRWHPSSAQGGGSGSLGKDFGLWGGPAALSILWSGDSRWKELSSQQGLEGAEGWAGWPWHCQELPEPFLGCQYPNPSCSEPWAGCCMPQSSLGTNLSTMCNLPFPDSRVLLKNFSLICLRQCFCNLYWAEILRELSEDFISWL